MSSCQLLDVYLVLSFSEFLHVHTAVCIRNVYSKHTYTHTLLLVDFACVWVRLPAKFIRNPHIGICGAFTYLLKFICNPHISISGAFVLHLCREGKIGGAPPPHSIQDITLPYFFGSHTVNQCPFHNPFNGNIFHIFVLFVDNFTI